MMRSLEREQLARRVPPSGSGRRRDAPIVKSYDIAASEVALGRGSNQRQYARVGQEGVGECLYLVSRGAVLRCGGERAHDVASVEGRCLKRQPARTCQLVGDRL
jgi:hypothetical protein